jgi:hypothetical protein
MKAVRWQASQREISTRMAYGYSRWKLNASIGSYCRVFVEKRKPAVSKPTRGHHTDPASYPGCRHSTTGTELDLVARDRLGMSTIRVHRETSTSNTFLMPSTRRCSNFSCTKLINSCEKENQPVRNVPLSVPRMLVVPGALHID